MRIQGLAAAVLLALLVPVTAGAGASVTFTPPPQPGDIFTVIDYSRDGSGQAQTTSVSESSGARHRSITVGSPYASCSRSLPAGIVVRFRHFTADSVPVTITTTGTIVRGPFQGGMPPEAAHRCYQLVS